MARTNNLHNYLEDIATAIKTKRGSSEPINASEFDNEIINLPSGGGAEPNIFLQMEEPSKKDGIWVQIDDELGQIVIDEDIYVNGEWKDNGYSTGNTGRTNSVYYKNCIYFMNSSNRLFKYDLQTKTTEQLQIYSNTSYQTNLVAYNDVIYSFSYTGSYFYVQMFNLNTNTNKSVSNVDYKSSYNMTACEYNGEIYLFGLNVSSNRIGVAKFNPETSQFTKLNSLPTAIGSKLKAGARIGKYMYIFSGSMAYRYDLESQTSVRLSDTPLSFAYIETTALVNDKIYVATSNDGIYRYNSENDTSEKFSGFYENYYGWQQEGICTDGEVIYLVNGAYTPTNGSSNVLNDKIFILDLKSKQYNENNLIIKQGELNSNAKKTQLYDNNFIGKMYSPILNVYYYKNNELLNKLPTYIGNGQEWERIK